MGGGGTGIGFIDNTVKKIEGESTKNKVGRHVLTGIAPSASNIVGTKIKNRPKAAGGNTPEVAAYNNFIATLEKTDLLTDAQKEEWMAKAGKLYAQNFNAGEGMAVVHRSGLAQGLSALQKEFGDIGKDVASRQAYTKAQSDAISGGVNAKLMQTQIASFLGATAAKKAM